MARLYFNVFYTYDTGRFGDVDDGGGDDGSNGSSGCLSDDDELFHLFATFFFC